jgi:hypothetical protein
MKICAPCLENAVEAFSSFKDFLREDKSHSLVPEIHPGPKLKEQQFAQNPACVLRLRLDL